MAHSIENGYRSDGVIRVKRNQGRPYHFQFAADKTIKFCFTSNSEHEEDLIAKCATKKKKKRKVNREVKNHETLPLER